MGFVSFNSLWDSILSLIRWIKILKLALGIILVVRGDKMVKQTVVIHFGNFFSTLFSPPCNVNKLLKGIPN
jgi:hypothetical protein